MIASIRSHWRYRRLRHYLQTLAPRLAQWRDRLPTAPLSEYAAAAAPDADPILDDVCMPIGRGRQEHDDLTPLLRIAKAKQPRVVVELGTAHGNTTANVCQECPEARILTVNALPLQQTGSIVTFALDEGDIGRVYRAHGFTSRVEQIYENTLNLDLSRYLKQEQIDLAIIDACHDTGYVVNDFLKVYPHLKDGALVMLHDTHPSMEGHLMGSYRACMKLRRRGFDIRHLEGTWWGVFRHAAAAVGPAQLAG